MAEQLAPGCFWCGEPAVAVVVRKRRGGKVVRGPWFECHFHAEGNTGGLDDPRDRCVYALDSEQAANYWQAAIKMSVQAMAAKLR